MLPSINIYKIAQFDSGYEMIISAYIRSDENVQNVSFNILTSLLQNFPETLSQNIKNLLANPNAVFDIDEVDYDMLEITQKLTLAVKKAFKILEYGQHSQKALERKLISKGFDYESSHNAAQFMLDKAFIDETEIALQHARVCVKKHWGKAKILLKIRHLEFGPVAYDDVCDYLNSVDFDTLCFELLLKKIGSSEMSQTQAQKIFASLSRAGFSSSQIKSAFRQLETHFKN